MHNASFYMIITRSFYDFPECRQSAARSDFFGTRADEQILLLHKDEGSFQGMLPQGQTSSR